MAEMKDQSGGGAYIILRCTKRIGAEEIRLDAKSEAGSQVAVITSTGHDGASDTFKMISDRGADINSVLRFAEQAMDEEL